MNNDYKNVSVDTLCEIIGLLSPTVDGYLFVYDFVNDFYFISPHAAERFALPSGNAFHNVENTLEKIVYPEDFPKLQEDFSDLRSSDRMEHNMLYRWMSAEGDPLWINCRGYVVRDNGKLSYMAGCVNEVGRQQYADNASGLLGDSSFRLYLDEFPSVIPKGFFMRIGLDNLKEITSRFGVEYGDMILRKTADFIAKSILPEQKLYRITSDEFLVVDFQGGTEMDGQNLYRDVRDEIRNFISENNYETMFTISAGLLCCNDVDDFSYSKVMQLLEFSLEEAKRQGHNLCYTYQEEDYTLFLKRRKLLQHLRQSINDGFEGFDAYYQPLFTPGTRELFGAEVLMRFHTEEFGMVSPGEFIPLLEETDLIIPAGRWIMHQALKACKEIQQYIPDFKISINLSHVQISRSSIGREILAAAEEYGVSPSHITIELTESGLLETDWRFKTLWSHLKEAGISLALDDFGTGYSNFHYLTELNPDIIKIDRTFAVEATTNEFEYELLSLFSKMIHQLNLKVCVEGVETENEFNTLSKLPPEYMQGFYLGRPCPFPQFMDQFVLSQGMA